MISKTPMNGLQRMMLRWEEFHPLNAAHVVRLGTSYDPSEVAEVATRTCRRLGLRPITFNAGRAAVLFHDEPAAGPRVDPAFEYRPFAGSEQAAVETVMREQLNVPFTGEPHWPLRFCLIDRGREGQSFVLIYQHAISDSRGISLVVREILRALDGRPAILDRLDLHPPPLAKLFPQELGWGSLLRWGTAALAEMATSLFCFQAPRRGGRDFSIEPGIRRMSFSTARLKETSRGLGVTVQVLVAAALLEALQLNFAEAISESFRRKIAVYTPADLRRDRKLAVDNVIGQMLGCITSRITICAGTPFRDVVQRIAEQTGDIKRDGRYREHSVHMDVMSGFWDWFPRPMNQRLWPFLFPVIGFISNVNLSEFLAEELASGLVQNYFRFTGTGILSPMMFGMTTLGDTLNITTTHHGNVFSNVEIEQISAHVEWRLSGRLDEVATPASFRSLPERLAAQEAVAATLPSAPPAATAEAGRIPAAAPLRSRSA